MLEVQPDTWCSNMVTQLSPQLRLALEPCAHVSIILVSAAVSPPFLDHNAIHRSFVAQMDHVLATIDWSTQAAPVPVPGIPGFVGGEDAESAPSGPVVPSGGTPTAGRPS